MENEFEKVDRLMELHGRYTTRVAAVERRLGTSDESYDDEEILLARMDAGLYTLQQVRRFAMSLNILLGSTEHNDKPYCSGCCGTRTGGARPSHTAAHRLVC